MGHNKPHSMVSVDDHSDKADYIDTPLSPMILTGGVISEGTNAGTFKVAELTALLRKTASDTGELTKITLVEQDNQVITNPDTEYHVILEYNSGSPRIQISTSRANGQTNLGIGKVMRETGNTVHYINSGNRLQSGVHRLHKRASELRRTEISEGFQIADEGSKKFSIAEGIAYRGINRFNFAIFDTSITAPDNFTYVYYNYNTSSWVYVPNQTDLNVDQYNLTSSGDGLDTCDKFKCDWVFIHPDDGHVYIVYGQDNDKKADIQITEVPEVPDLVDKFGVLIGRIIVEGGEAVFDEIQQVKYTIFRPKTVTDHNDLSSLQGGSLAERNHLTNAQISALHSNSLDHIQGTDQKLDDGGANEVTVANVKDAVDKKHDANADTDLDATFEATFVKKVDNVKELADITSDGADIEDAVTKKHAQNGDTSLGTQTADINMDTHKLTSLSVPSSNGDSIRATTKITEANLEDAIDKKHVVDIISDTTPELGGELDAGAHTIGFTQQALVVAAQACAINWKNSNKAKLTVDDDVTVTFDTNPSNPCSLTLVIVQDGTGGHTVTLPGTIKWAGGSAPTLSTGANDIDILSLYFDGSVYYGVASLDFATA